MAVAYFIAHAPHSFFPLLNHGEPAILYSFVFLFIAAAGPGAWALDDRWVADRRGVTAPWFADREKLSCRSGSRF